MTDGAAGEPAEPAEYLRRLFDDVELSYLVVAAAQLGIADALACGPQSVDDLAAVTGAHAPSLYRVLRRLAVRGLFREDRDREFCMTPLAEPLRADVPDTIRPQVLWSGTAAYQRSWGDLAYSVRTGLPAFDHHFGASFFDHLAGDPALAQVFNDVMTRSSRADGAAIAAAHDFSGYRRIVDVGGGHGALLAAILDRYPGPTGVLFDRPGVVGTAGGAIDRHLADGRAETLAGDFSAAVPAGADAYLLKWVIHDWDDETAVSILARCRTAMAPAGRVLLVEVVIPDGRPGPDVTGLDTTMLVFTGSRERTESEYRRLLDRAGLTLLAVTPTASPFSVLEAAAAGHPDR